MLTRPSSPTGEIEELKPFEHLKQMLEMSVEEFADRPAFNVKDTSGVYKQITYKEFYDDVNSFGTALVSLGLKGEKIAVIGENSYEWCLTYLSVVNGTGIIVPLDKELPENEIANLMVRAEVTAIVYSNKMAKTIEKLASFVPTLKYLVNMNLEESNDNIYSLKALLENGRELLKEGVTSFVDAEIDPNAMSIILFTSGTTDLAKGVMISHKNICSNIISVLQSLYISCEDSALSILPLHHTYECTCGFLVMIASGCKISFCEGIKHIGKNLKETGPSILMLVPLIIEAMYKRIWNSVRKVKGKTLQLKLAIHASNFVRRTTKVDYRKKLFSQIHENVGGNLRLIISGAAAIDPAVAEGFESMGITIRQGYGLTECSPIVSVNQLDNYKHSSIGLPLAGIELRVDNPDEDGIGELVTKGDNVMLGYYKNEEATKIVLKDGWFYTGDLGYKDQDGFFYITGRQKNVIVTKNGKNIFPEEVESYLNKSPFISECLVYGVETPKGETLVKAQIIVDEEEIKNRFKGQTLSKEEIYNLVKNEVKHTNRQMPLYKRVSDFTIRENEFEKTSAKKIKRYGQGIES